MQISLGRGTFVPLRLPHLATPLQTNKHKQSLTGKADITIDIYIYFTFSAVSVFFYISTSSTGEAPLHWTPSNLFNAIYNRVVIS